MEPVSDRFTRLKFYSRPLILLWMLLISGSVTPLVQAQDVQLEATVNFIAGQNIYLNIGAADGIQESDTLRAYRDNELLGNLQVVAVTQASTVTTFAGVAFAVTRGDILTIIVGVRAEVADTPAQAPAADSSVVPERRSVFEQGTTEVQLPPVEEGIRVTGRLALSMDLSQTNTEGLTAAAFDRTRIYRIPTVNLRAAVEELPGGLRLNANGRFAHRNNDSRLGISPLNATRIYQLNLERALPGRPLQARVGRFFNPAETFSGFWDGAGVAYVPDTGFGGGVLAGFQPERADESFTDEFPKYTVFGSFTHSEGEQRYHANVSFHQVFPDNQLLDHTFVGLTHTFRQKNFRVRNLVQIDEDPASNTWKISRLQVQGIIPAGDRLTLRARYILRQPYQFYRTDQFFGYQRERISGGFSLRAFSGTISADVSTNSSDIESRSFTYATFVSFPSVGPLNLGINGAVHYWRRSDNADVLYIAPSVSKSFGRAYTQLQYQFQRSNFDVIENDNHTIEWALNFPIARRVRSSIRLQSRWGSLMSMYRVYTTLWMKI